MRMKLRWPIILSLMFLVLVPVAADLKDFKEDVEKEEKEKSDQTEKQADSKDEEKTEEQKKLEEAFWSFIFQIWFLSNYYASYDEYPYATGRFIRHEEPPGEFEESQTAAGSTALRKLQRFEFRGGAVWSPGNGAGFEAALTGKLFPFFGPEIEVTALFDASDRQDIILAGSNFSFFQVDFLSLDFYAQAAFMNGLVSRSGGALGMAFRSFPGAPVALSGKAGLQAYANSVVFADFRLEAGIMVNRFEFRAGWAWLRAQYAELDRLVASITIHF